MDLMSEFRVRVGVGFFQKAKAWVPRQGKRVWTDGESGVGRRLLA